MGVMTPSNYQKGELKVTRTLNGIYLHLRYNLCRQSMLSKTTHIAADAETTDETGNQNQSR